MTDEHSEWTWPGRPSAGDVLKWAFVVFAIGMMALLWITAIVAVWNVT